ncbi:hypothetical protein [Pseudomonas oryzihabitans]|nr:hypothetical protein [Pseudomonas psychrotolerans]MDR6679831.1 DNA-binding GntR family transcriptional regulator [Pseudomonas psychrotolerans]
MSQDEHLAMEESAVDQDLDRAEALVRQHVMKAAIAFEGFFGSKKLSVR